MNHTDPTFLPANSFSPNLKMPLERVLDAMEEKCLLQSGTLSNKRVPANASISKRMFK